MDPQTQQIIQQFMQWIQQQQGGQQGQGQGVFGGQQGNGTMQDPMSALLTLINTPFALNALRTPYNMQMQAAQTAMNPNAMMARYGQFFRPLSKQLTNEVTEAAGPSIAARGMATSPGQVSRMLGEALAPDVMQEQNQAMNAAMGSMQMPFNIGSGVAGQYPSSLAGMGQSTGGALNELLNFIQGQKQTYNATPDYGFNSQGTQQQNGPSLFGGPSSEGFMYQ